MFNLPLITASTSTSSAYAAALHQAGHKDFALTILGLPSGHRAFDSSLEPGPEVVSDLLATIKAAGVELPALTPDTSGVTSVAFLSTIINEINGAYPVSTDPFVKSFEKIAPISNLLDTTVTMDFAVAMVDWAARFDLLGWSLANDHLTGFKGKAGVIVDYLRLCAAGLGMPCPTQPSAPVRAYTGWLARLDPTGIPIVCQQGVKCQHHSHLTKLTRGTGFEPGALVCFESLLPPVPHSAADIALLSIITTNFNYAD